MDIEEPNLEQNMNSEKDKYEPKVVMGPIPGGSIACTRERRPVQSLQGDSCAVPASAAGPTPARGYPPVCCGIHCDLAGVGTRASERGMASDSDWGDRGTGFASLL